VADLGDELNELEGRLRRLLDRAKREGLHASGWRDDETGLGRSLRSVDALLHEILALAATEQEIPEEYPDW